MASNRASDAIEAARRVFPRSWFNEATTEAGRDALGYYHERQNEKRSFVAMLGLRTRFQALAAF
jgi:phage terminase large subunit